MRAVNLIPGESRRGSGGIGPFVLIGVLALALAGAVGYVLTHNTVVDRRAQLASLQTQQTMMQTQAARVQPYREF
ncbi:MAG TPA: hypothetical protein VFV85_05770, partial [Conexibacter sp.]|nr:hypothetical protein [Conexibacter sp.]